MGEVSAAAEGFGIHPGMRMGEALARCPRLALVPPDPVGVADAWERVLVALEAAGALVEPGRPGLACFEARGLRRLHGGSLDGVLEATRETLRRTGVGAARLGAGPSRFCAIVAAAARARARRAGFVAGADGLAGERVALLRRTTVLSWRRCPRSSSAWGSPRSATSPRCRAPRWPIASAARAARPRPRRRRRHAAARRAVPARSSRRCSSSRSPRRAASSSGRSGCSSTGCSPGASATGARCASVVLGATLVEGGTWRERVVFREPLSDAGRMRLVLAQRLALLPAPAESLRLSVERFGPPHPGRRGALRRSSARRRARLREAIRQVRAAAGPEAALRILAVDPDSRVPERRAVLTPFEV